MSDIVEMIDTVGPYERGEVYRVRSRNAQELLEKEKAVLSEEVLVEPENEGL